MGNACQWWLCIRSVRSLWTDKRDPNDKTAAGELTVWLQSSGQHEASLPLNPLPEELILVPSMIWICCPDEIPHHSCVIILRARRPQPQKMFQLMPAYFKCEFQLSVSGTGGYILNYFGLTEGIPFAVVFLCLHGFRCGNYWIGGHEIRCPTLTLCKDGRHEGYLYRGCLSLNQDWELVPQDRSLITKRPWLLLHFWRLHPGSIDI